MVSEVLSTAYYSFIDRDAIICWSWTTLQKDTKSMIRPLLPTRGFSRTCRSISTGNRRNKTKIQNEWLHTHTNYDRKRHADVNRSTGGIFFVLSTAAAGVSIFIMGKGWWENQIRMNKQHVAATLVLSFSIYVFSLVSGDHSINSVMLDSDSLFCQCVNYVFALAWL